jgi:PqqD family protein of HPr-rel-A system
MFTGICNHDFGIKAVRRLSLTPAGRELEWQGWEDVFSVYQPSSTETHVFNDMTAALLQSLEKGALTMADVAEAAAAILDMSRNELSDKDLSFAIGRLEELGLVDWSDEVA